MRELSIENTLPQRLTIDSDLLAKCIAALDGYFEAPAGELSIVFVESNTLTQMHIDYFDDPKPTDIITFPINEPDCWGELYINPQAAADYVAQNSGDFSEELTRYVIHGYLHLLGHDDIEPDDYDKMKLLEAKGLSLTKHAHKIFSL